MEELIANCLRTYEETGEAGLREFLDSHPDERTELESCLAELRAVGMVGPLEAPAEAPGPPRTLGEFELREQIGSGGMGVVYRAWQPSLQREVALKVVRTDRLHLRAARERFRKEAEAIARMHHPGIVPLFAVGEDDGIPWFAMELVDGRTLDEGFAAIGSSRPSALRGEDLRCALGCDETARLAFDGTWTEACVHIGVQVADALSAAHDAAVLHRDVKPSNVIVTRTGRVMLFDFGLAQSIGPDRRLTRTGDSVGSPIYMAPEQIRGAAADPRTDVYGLGVTLYELLALEPPFVATDEIALRERIVHGDSVPLRHRHPGIPRDVETIIARAMDPDPRRRYRDAAALRNDLRRFLAHEPIHARPAGLRIRLLRFCQRRPAIAVATVMATLLAVGVPTAVSIEQVRSARAVDVESKVAEHNLQTALAALDRFLSRFGADELTYTPGLDALGAELLGESIALYEDLARERPDDRRVMAALAEAHRKAAWLRKRVGDLDGAQAAADKALAALPLPTDAESRKGRAEVLGTRAAISRARGEFETSATTLREAIATLHPDGDESERGTRIELRIAHGRVLTDSGQTAAAEAEFLDCVAELASLSDRLPEATDSLRADLLRSLATAQIRLGHDAQAIDALRGAAAILDPRLATGKATTGERQMAGEVRGKLAGLLAEAGQRKAARESYERCLELMKGLVDEFPDAVTFRQSLILDYLLAAGEMPTARADELLQLAADEIERSAPDEGTATAILRLRVARARLDRHAADATSATCVAALETALEPLQREPTLAQLSPRDLHQVANALHSLASARHDTGDAAADPLASRAVELKERVVAAITQDVELRESLANSRNLLGVVRANAKRFDDALLEYAAAIRIREQLRAAGGDNPDLCHRLAGTLCNAAGAALEIDDPTRALDFAERAETLEAAAVATTGRKSWRTRLFVARYMRGQALLHLDRLAEIDPVVDAILTTKSDSEDALVAAILLADAAERAGPSDAAVAEDFAVRAVTLLGVAGERGFSDWGKAANWDEFRVLRDREDFRALLERNRK